jgi:ABC-2 type transport system ATP-binding protein
VDASGVSAPAGAAIRIEHLTKRFGPKIAVNDLNLTVPPGEFFCFLGPNGAGKTTTIKVLTGLLSPTEGRAVLGGHDMAREPVAAKRLLGYVPDTPFLYEKLTGREFMRFVAGLYAMDASEYEAYSEELLDLFTIRGVGDQLIEDYSHGMRQKLSFAACFLHRPSIMIVDEPWVGLDPKSIRFVKDFLRAKTRAENLTVFMSTHTLAIAEEIADRIGIIHQGKLLHVGSVPEILAMAHQPGSLEDVFLQLTHDETEGG